MSIAQLLARLGAEQPVRPHHVTGLLEHLLGSGDVRVRVEGHVCHRRVQELLEDRQRQPARVGHRRLDAAFRLLAQRGAVDRQADRLAHRQLIGRELGQVRHQAVGLNRREPHVVVGVAVDEHLLHAGDEVARPMELVGLQRRQRGVGRCVRRELHGPDGRLAAPIGRVRLERDSLRRELRDAVRAGADRVRVRVLARVAHLAPDRLRDDVCLARDVLQVGVLGRGEVAA